MSEIGFVETVQFVSGRISLWRKIQINLFFFSFVFWKIEILLSRILLIHILNETVINKDLRITKETEDFHYFISQMRIKKASIKRNVSK